MATMPTIQPRRSARLHIYDSNGRDYLANTIGWSRQRLEGWLTSPTVRPHLQLWYQLCISGRRRFNEAVDWINTGEKGYFYNARDLEEDLLLACLGEGDGEASRDGLGYADEGAKTRHWTAQELWARTAWRIVQANRLTGLPFEMMAVEHPSACYAFLIDVLCIAFHSIAFRGNSSCYHQLLNGSTTQIGSQDFGDINQKDVLDDRDSGSISSVATTMSSTETSNDSADLDFVERSSQTSASSEETKTEQAASNAIGDRIGAREVEEWLVSTRIHGDVEARSETSGECMLEQDQAVNGHGKAGYESQGEAES